MHCVLLCLYFLNTVLLSIGTCSNFEIIIIIFERENIGSGTIKAASALRKSYFSALKNTCIFIVKLLKIEYYQKKKKKKKK